MVVLLSIRLMNFAAIQWTRTNLLCIVRKQNKVCRYRHQIPKYSLLDVSFDSQIASSRRAVLFDSNQLDPNELLSINIEIHCKRNNGKIFEWCKSKQNTQFAISSPIAKKSSVQGCEYNGTHRYGFRPIRMKLKKKTTIALALNSRKQLPR